MRVARASLALLTGALLAVGCAVRAEEPVAYVEVTSAPANVYAYPSVIYEGRPTYFVNDRWVYRDGSRWLYYRREPPELYQSRPYVRSRPYVQQAPPAYAPPARPVYPQPAPYPQRAYPTYPSPNRGPY